MSFLESKNVSVENQTDGRTCKWDTISVQH